MRNTFPVWLNESGQAMLISAGIGMVLIISLVTTLFVTQMSNFHQSSSAQRMQIHSVNDDGLSYAMSELGATQGVWNQSLGGNFPPVCTAGQPISVLGLPFKLACSVDPIANPGLQPYQVAVTIVTLATSGSSTVLMPVKAIKAYASANGRWVSTCPPACMRPRRWSW